MRMQMKLAIGGAITAFVLLVGTAGIVLAQSQTPQGQTPQGQNPSQDPYGNMWQYCTGGPTNGGAGMSMGGYDLLKIADLLKTTPQDITTQRQAGKSLVQIATAKGVSEDELINAIVDPVKERLNLQVKYNYLTQQQADAYLSQFRDRVKTAINDTTPLLNGENGWSGMMGGGMMGNGAFGGMMGGGVTGGGGMMGNGAFGGMMGSGMMGGYTF
ncbi:MAG: hypothetical protein M1358_20845 [Chloroflexi bacterium]|nr:hypothetical protein [Chloroflexota bacterium]